MTRYLIISDVHANLPALEAVLTDAEGSYDSVICLGDTIGFNEWPNECVALVREIAEISIIGNHDYWTLAGTGQDDTLEVLEPESTSYLKALPLEHSTKRFLIVHANPADPQRFAIFIDSRYRARKAFAAFHQQLCLVGHSHSPKVYQLSYEGAQEELSVRQLLMESDTQELEMVEAGRYIVDIGSVGLYEVRRDEATYGLYEPDSGILTLKKVVF